MATLREYFHKNLEGLGQYSDLKIQNTKDGTEVIIVELVHYNEVAGVSFVGYFFPASTYKFELVQHLLSDPQSTIKRASSVQIISSHEASDLEDRLEVNKLRFSNKVHVYIDDYLEKPERDKIRKFAMSRNLSIGLHDKHFSDWLDEHEKPWAFISHDSRNKKDLAKPLAEKLSSMLCPVWYDEFSLKVGQSIRESIDAGLKESKKCIIILSPEFISNPGWTKAEFNAVMNMHISKGGAFILPVWDRVTSGQVREYSPLVADIKGLDSELGIDELARQLFTEINPIKSS